MKYYFIVFLLVLSANSVKADDDRQEAVINDNVLILDVSKSMQGEIEGDVKVDLLKKELSGFIKRWPEEEKLAVLSYGMNGSRESCKRVRTLSTIKTLDKDSLLKKVKRITAQGRAPMISAIYKAERRLKNRKGNIILVSDGGETCRKKQSVCKIAKRMKRNHPDIKIHTIDMEGSNKVLQCIAEVTGGRYHTIYGLQGLASLIFSTNATGLDEQEDYVERTGSIALSSVETVGGQVVPASYIIYSDEGKHVVSYTAHKNVEHTLPVGKYTVTSIHNLFTQEVKLDVNADENTKHTFVLGTSGQLSLSAKYRGRPASTLYTIYDSKGVELLSNISDKAFTQSLPVGEYRVEAQYDGDMKVVKFDVEKNDVKNVQIRF